MLTELQRRKFTRLFQMWDYDKDGVLRRGDYEQAAHAIANFLGIQAGSPEMDTHMTHYMAGWEQLQPSADANGDERVTLDEFLSATSFIVSNPSVFEGVTMSSASNSIRWMDRDGDGRIAREEYLGVVTSYQMTMAEAEEAFSHLDRDGDGYITQAESLTNTREFFLSQDPEARGNWLFGPY